MRGLRAFFGTLAVMTATAVVVGCENEPRNENLPLPDRTISAATFDTVVWTDSAAARARGKDVYAWVCARCHGVAGRGDGGEVLAGDTLHPPSFQDPNWRFANDARGLWNRIHLGNNRGMPHWGEQGLQPRDIVAVASYILHDLRVPQPQQN